MNKIIENEKSNIIDNLRDVKELLNFHGEHKNTLGALTILDNSMYLLHRVQGESGAFKFYAGLFNEEEHEIIEKIVKKNKHFYLFFLWYYEIE